MQKLIFGLGLCLIMAPIAECAQQAPVAQVQRSQELLNNQSLMEQLNRPMGVLIRSITIQGFVLRNRRPFEELFKPYRNKHLTTQDMEAIQDQLEEIYEQAGYQGLVSITHRIQKKHLTFVVSLLK